MEKIKSNLPESTQKELIKLFGKKTVREIAEQVNLKERSVSHFYMKNNFKLTKDQKSKLLFRRRSKYDRNNHFFREKSNKSIYWAGFIAADGYVNKTKLRIKLKYTDKSHLEKFKNDIEYTGIIRKDCAERLGKTHCGALLYISSREIVEDLKSLYSITERKSLTLRPPSLKESEVDYFILGYFDGDGTVYQKRQYKCVRFYGTKWINLWIKERIDHLHGSNSGSIFKKGNIWCFELNPSASELFIKHYGCLESPRLNRKWKVKNS
tara:strand:- start:2242 stop:3039 length:798 start_codon:yes stop_codon:yes gene_type:complete